MGTLLDENPLEPQDQLPLTRCAEVWYDDGTTVLVAEDKGYRIYSGTLAQQSEVFADIFNIPQLEPAQQETYDGCSVVQLQDSPLDIQYFLKAIHNISFYNIDTIMRFDIIASILKLSNKYGASHLRQQSILALQRIYPPTLEEFMLARPHRLSLDPGHFFFAANLPREMNLQALLPGILLCYCSLEMDEILDGVQFAHSTKDTPMLLELNSVDKRAVIRARHTLAQFTRAVTLRPLFAADSQCSTAKCRASARAIAEMHIEGRKSDGFVNPLCYFVDTGTGPVASMCGPCLGQLKQIIQAGRIELWRRLPQIFGLENRDAVRVDD